MALVGADWDREHVLDLLKTTDRREVAGAAAQSMGHGLAAFRDDGVPVFIATRPADAAPADGMNKVEQAARELIGIPDGL